MIMVMFIYKIIFIVVVVLPYYYYFIIIIICHLLKINSLFNQSMTLFVNVGHRPIIVIIIVIFHFSKQWFAADSFETFLSRSQMTMKFCLIPE